MRESFKKALRLYKWLTIIFIIGFTVYLLVDDFSFWSTYPKSNLPEMLLNASIWLLIYTIMYSVYYWLIITGCILIYNRMIKPKKILNRNKTS